MTAQRNFEIVRRRIKMKHSNTSIILLFLLFTSLFSPIIAEKPVSSNIPTEEKKEKIEQASLWNKKGEEYYKKEEYDRSIECFWKAVELNPDKVEYVINLTQVYRDYEKFEEAEKLINKSLEKFPKKEDQKKLQIELADVHFCWAKNFLSEENDSIKALKHFEFSYRIDKIYRPKNSVLDLNFLGFLYFDFGKMDKALEYSLNALKISREVGDQIGEVAALNNIGNVYAMFLKVEKALDNYNKALKISQEIEMSSWEAKSLANIGLLYYDIGDNKKALEFFKKNLLICRKEHLRMHELIILNYIGMVQQGDIGQKQLALKAYEKSLQINKEFGLKRELVTSYNNIATYYGEIGDYKKSLDSYKKALLIANEIGNRLYEAIILKSIGSSYKAIGDMQKALYYYQKSLSMAREVDHSDTEAKILSNLMSFWRCLNKIRFSIFFGKQSVNIYQKLRSNISGLKIRLQMSYLENKKDRYRQLIILLINDSRLTEAQQVLDMLKEEEFFEFILKDRSSHEILYTTVDFTKFEKQWLEKYNNVMEKLSKVCREYHFLKIKSNKNETEEKMFKELALRLNEETKAYEEFLAQMRDAFDKYEKDTKERKITTDTLAKEVSTLQVTLKYLDGTKGGKHAALQYLVYKDRISVIVTTSSSQMVKHTEINEKDFNWKVMTYRNFMMQAGRGAIPIIKTKSTEIKKYEKHFYKVLFEKVDEELKKYGATNLVVSLDGILRYLPLGALWDGKIYLLQRYRIAVITLSSLKNIKEEPVKEMKILGLGASRGGQGFPPLPNVPAEIRFVVKNKESGYNGLINGKAFIDDDFTRDTMIDQLKSGNYPLVHIASHFQFSPGDETKNLLLLGDGTTMKLSEIRRLGKLFDNVQLLTLSACQTAVGGNGEEIDGFGELAQQGGARSVVASLWPVADESTKYLMVNFYEKLKTGKATSKLEALRQAQLELAGLEDLLTKDKNKSNQLARKKSNYSHPYYWGPFILMGNWR